LWNEREFEFRDLKPGTWLIGVIINRNQVVDHAVLDLQGGLVEQNLRGSAADPETFVTVRIEGPDGSLVRRAILDAKYIGTRAYRTVGRGSGQDDGTYRLPFEPLAERLLVSDGRYYAEAFTRAFGTARTEFDPEDQGTVTIRYSEPSRLVVTLAGYVDSPYQGATTLQLSEIDEERGVTLFAGRYGFDAKLGDDGVQEYRGLQAGLKEIAVQVNTDGGGYLLVTSDRVRVGPGENRHTLALPPLYTQRVRVDGDTAGQRFRLSPVNGLGGYWGVNLLAPEGGVFVFRRLPAGEYELTESGRRDTRTMYFTVPNAKSLAFEPVTVNALRVTVGDGSGPLAAAGLRDGDLIVGLDGEEFRNRTHMDALLKLARTRDSVELTVFRDRSTLTVTADLRRYWEGGGALRPTGR
ncbi:MAG: PDZ domain-containing protein, partial [Planctomycetota bacterium]